MRLARHAVSGAVTPFNGTQNARMQFLYTFVPANPNAMSQLFRAP